MGGGGAPGSGFYGALVGKELDDGSFELGFDDGECRRMSRDLLRGGFDAATLRAARPDEAGIIDIASETGNATAAEFVVHNGKTVGLLVGKEGPLGGWGTPIFMSFYLAEGAFTAPKRVRRKTAEMSTQDRQGLHTFVRGDVVEFIKLEKGEADSRAIVYGCVNASPAGSDKQFRKMLILYDKDVGMFFLGTWPSWRRVRKPSVLVTEFDCDNGDHTQTIGAGGCQQMLDSWKDSLWPASITR